MKQTKANHQETKIENKTVALRKEELLKAGFSETGIFKQSSARTSAPVVKLNHPTLSRAMGPKRRLPTQTRPRREATFFTSTAQESGVSGSEENLINKLTQAIKSAQVKYREHYLKGAFSRQESGWLSGLRHRMLGQSRAQSVSEIQANTFEAVLKKLDDFFYAPETRYNFHSFTSYLLDEFILLLEQANSSVTVIRPKSGEHYNPTVWSEIRESLAALLKESSLNYNHSATS
ncbi:hypothetical protein [Legionella clemsonensis]|uniref:Uncharacterized protein n=1 Tax=Legionella clemsonensis TaxID=1867846 RepID=A0A222P6I6_9GAMM|nr:hypothetical protein [Legionella clemsonensis]ASQ47480.1 hypothetical protein clem_14775 [Legionella clemsonensis]